MKNQYFGDVNDYRKYSLLRHLAQSTGLSLAVCWMLTPSDGSNDGQNTQYLRNPKAWRHIDPPLFDLLTRTVLETGFRHVSTIERSGLLPVRAFHDLEVPQDRVGRRAWTRNALDVTAGADLVFFDPDNGMEVKSTPPGRKNSPKYLLWSEIREFFARGPSLLIYQHFPRVQRDRFMRELCHRLREETGAEQTLVSPGSHSAFFLVLQNHHATAAERAVTQGVAEWKMH